MGESCRVVCALNVFAKTINIFFSEIKSACLPSMVMQSHFALGFVRTNDHNSRDASHAIL